MGQLEYFNDLGGTLYTRIGGIPPKSLKLVK